MRTYPLVPIGAAAPARALAPVIAILGGWLKAFAQARRHRAQCRALAGLDGRMLADMGISRADVRDAFSEPFWEDPTALLRERALERRLYRTSELRLVMPASAQRELLIKRACLERPARQAV
ncbi:MAG: DUF1127 domain-containing protein [Pseudolabrys sp.]|nr:DUF1127 domain-containing protein [Pseudolabrys sp.]MBV9262377.1 DUF1127 domain-containing protein [Pseudolabrys sp.]